MRGLGRELRGGARRGLGGQARFEGRRARRGGAARHHPLRLTRSAAGHGRACGAAEVARRRVALIDVLRHRARDHDVELRRQPTADRRGHRRRCRQLRPQLRLVALALERHPAGEREVQHAAERVHVGARIDAPAADLLRRHVVERPDPLTGARAAGAGEDGLGQPEVGQIDVVVAVDEQVRRLHVAMHEPGPVDRVQRRGGLPDDLRRPRGVERTAVADLRAQVVTGHEPHRDVRDAVVLAGRVHRDHVRVVDAGRRARLGQEPRADVVVVEQLGRDHLQRDDPFEVELDRPVDDAHPAPAHERLDPVSGHDRAGSEVPHLRCISEPDRTTKRREFASGTALNRRVVELAEASPPGRCD